MAIREFGMRKVAVSTVQPASTQSKLLLLFSPF